MKSGFIAITGRPNAGKSTLLNRIIGEKVAIVSSKPQTTRTKILGVYTEKDLQLVLIDTPGIHKPHNKLGKRMEKYIYTATQDIDALVYVVDCNIKDDEIELEKESLGGLKTAGIPVILAVNKIDTKQRLELLPVLDRLQNMYDFEAIVPISAKEGENMSELFEKLKECVNEGPKFFPDDVITDQPERQIVSEYIREKAKALSGQTVSNTPTPEPKANNVIIGSDKDSVRKIFDGYKETKSIMSDNALDFENNDLLVTVYFNGEDKADGVLFMQNSFDGVDTLTGEGSYISKHYDELVAMATNDPNIKIETDLTKYNSQGVKKYPMEIYIGNIPESKPKSTENTDSGYAQFNPETGHYEKTDGKTEPKQQSNNAETKPKSEFSYCLMSGIVQGVKLYSAPNNDSYVGTITSFSNDILDERGKKTKAVYISGGKNDGWYKRSEVGQLYVRNDDPCLPSGRYVAESMGVD